jgi:glycosyltransferase involved in cell wall biosynthesis
VRSRRYDVCAAVVSDLTYDARVWKEARSLARAGYRVALIGCRYDLDTPQWRREGDIDVFEVSLGTRTKVSLVGRLRTLLRLWLEILRTPAHAYHAHNIHVGPAAWLASKWRRAALVYDAHELYGEAQGDALHRIAARAERPLERWMVRSSRLVITTNDSRRRRLRERYGDIRVDVLANVPPLVRVVEPLDPGFPKDRSVLLYQGGIYAEGRAFRETIEALALLDDVELVIIGFGRENDLELIRRWAAESGVSARVHLLPPRSFDELVRTAAAASVGLVPVKPNSLNNYLGDTNKLFEYLMAGLPVVASDLPEIRRVVSQGEPPVGELFDPSSPASIADAVRKVLGPGIALRGREARRLAVDRFNWNIEEQRLLEGYRELIGAPPGGPA